MKTTDLFTGLRSGKKINEAAEKIFGKKLNLETFNLDQLQDARNRIRTQLSQTRTTSGFNENLENDAYHEAQWMLNAINVEMAEREEFIIDNIEADAITNETDGDTLFNYKSAEERNNALVNVWTDAITRYESDKLEEFLALIKSGMPVKKAVAKLLPEAPASYYQTEDAIGDKQRSREYVDYKKKIENEKPDALGNYEAWVKAGRQPWKAYQSATAGDTHQSIKRKIDNINGYDIFIKKRQYYVVNPTTGVVIGIDRFLGNAKTIATNAEQLNTQQKEL